MRYLCIAALLCTLATTARPDPAVTFYGPGTASCGKWTASSRNVSDRFLLGSWVLGWVSAAGYYGRMGTLRHTDSEAIQAWIDNYCHDHPLELISDAVIALVTELAKPPG